METIEKRRGRKCVDKFLRVLYIYKGESRADKEFHIYTNLWYMVPGHRKVVSNLGYKCWPSQRKESNNHNTEPPSCAGVARST